MSKYRLADPHHWTDIEGGREWSSEVRNLFKNLGYKVRDSEYGASYFYTKNGELRECGYHRFMDCGCKEIDLNELKNLVKA